MKRLRKLTAGDPLGDGPHSAGAWNELVDTAAIVERARQTGASLSRGPMFADRTMVLIRNASDVAVDRFGILGITDSVLNPTYSANEFKRHYCLEGDTPVAPDHYGKFAVLAQPLAVNAIGWATVSGICVATVDYDYDDQPYADIKPDDDRELAGAEGGVQVLWKESGTGSLLSILRLGVPYWPILRGKLDGDLTQASGSATMSIWEGTTLADSGRNVTVYDPGAITSGKKIASGVGLTASFTAGKWYLLTPYACEVTA
jgi:hypothetical protein